MNKKEILTTLLGIMIAGIGMGSSISGILYTDEDLKIKEK